MARILFMIGGESASGKSASLMNLKNPERIFYLGTESNKPLPFPDKFKKLINGLQDPKDIWDLFNTLENSDDFDTIIIDSITFLMDMYESVYIHGSSDSRTEWGNYQQFFKRLMQDVVSKSTKNWIITAHVAAELMNNGNYRYFVPVKGALAKQGLEAYLSIIVYARKVKIDELEEMPYDGNLLHITARDRAVGYKHVFQCEVTKEYADSKIRAPIGCFSPEQIYMDNDAQMLLEHLEKYYGLEPQNP